MTVIRPLPGIRFEAGAPPLRDALPRMDIPLFAGFAASGPLHTPVAVEDAAELANVFGGDVELPRPRDVREPRYAHLGPTVRAFFRNRGRRCWVIRVAGAGAVQSRFRVPNLLKVAGANAVEPAFATARSHGSWADALSVQTNIVSRPLRLVTFTNGATPSIDVAVASPREVGAGDLVRLSWPEAGVALHLFVESAATKGGIARLRGRSLWLKGDEVVTNPAVSGRLVTERLAFDLTVRAEGQPPLRMSGLGFSAEHPRYFGALPTDERLFGDGPDPRWQAMWRDASRPRFPLAVPFDGSLYVPAGMDALFSHEQRAEPHAAGAFERDGLAQFGPELFIDPNLSDTTVHDLLGRANALRDLQQVRLIGIHSAIAIEEATMLAAPDAVHRGWLREADPTIELVSPPPSPPAAAPKRRATFADCLSVGPAILPAQTGRIAGPTPIAWVSLPENDDPDDTLTAVHEAMIRMSAARADMVALLSLPRHYEARRAVAHAATLGALDAQTLSYAALNHPWVVMRDEDAGPLRTFPPDGAMAGVMASRAATRGAWVAPANEPLLGVVALTPAIGSDALQSLQDAGVNVIRREPSGFVCLDAETLTSDEDVRALNVRRLLILLRRVAVRVGNDYAFEPHSSSLRNAVKRGFEDMLASLFARGAFAGRTAKLAFQVITDETVNTRSGADAGRLVAEIRVAPSRPLTFLTIRLLQHGDAAIVQEVR